LKFEIAGIVIGEDFGSGEGTGINAGGIDGSTK
jgi:pSer/pThr/pTyr-binding forkhead associated (FHA) protein